MKRMVWAIAAAAACWGAAPARAGDWQWQLPAARYQKLDQFERAQLDRAAALVEKKGFKAAAAEFEKFKVQFPDSAILPYALFMRGYCLQQSNNRVTAITVYQEVLDFFPDSIDDSAAALFFMAMSHQENGDTSKAIKALQALADDPRLKDHCLTAGAVRRLADHFWAEQHYDDAVTYWKQVVSRYSGKNDTEVNAALKSVTGWYVKNQDYAGYEAWLLPDAKKNEATTREWIVENAWNVAWDGFRGDWEKYAAASEKERLDKNKLKARDMQAFYEYLKTRREWYEKTGRVWTYHDRALRFLTSVWGDRAAREAAIDDAVAFVKQLPNKAEADGKFSQLIDFLKEQKQHARARYLLALLQDRTLALYKDYELLFDEARWPQAVARLLEVEKSGNESWRDRAMWDRASLYKDRTGEFEKAIKLYNEISKPPGTLWAIQDAYHRWGKLKESLDTLTEIEAMFQDDAPRAAWQKAQYVIAANDKKTAVALARRIMKMYPKSQESASAHRWLQDNGVASGGGVSDE